MIWLCHRREDLFETRTHLGMPANDVLEGAGIEAYTNAIGISRLPDMLAPHTGYGTSGFVLRESPFEKKEARKSPWRRKCGAVGSRCAGGSMMIQGRSRLTSTAGLR